MSEDQSPFELPPESRSGPADFLSRFSAPTPPARPAAVAPGMPASVPEGVPAGQESPEESDTAFFKSLPADLQASRRYAGRMCVAGEGKVPSDIVFLTTSLTDEDAESEITSAIGRKIAVKPRYGKGIAGCILKDILSSIQIDINEHYITALVKWIIPKGERSKPKKPHINAGLALLHAELKRIQPKIIVTFGKPAFEAVCPMRIKFNDIRAGWFYSKEYDAKVFVMQDFYLPVLKPEMVEKFRIELLDVKKVYDQLRGIGNISTVEQDLKTINNWEALQEFTNMLIGEKKNLLSVDCEFGGRNHVDGRLRSLQVCFDNGRARYIRMMDDKLNFVFDTSYKGIGDILKPHFDNPKTEYIGYHISADLPWMHYHLGLEWYRKCFMDVEFAEQVLNENQELGLERTALIYTRLGRYDIPLVEWKMENPGRVTDDLGYLLVPDEILIPYSLYDVLVPMQAAPIIMRRMMLDNVWDYYLNFRHPLVTDMFTQFAIYGLPIKVSKLDSLRELYSYSRDLCQDKFKKLIVAEAEEFLFQTLMETPDPGQGVMAFHKIKKLRKEDKFEEAFDLFKTTVGLEALPEKLPIYTHYADSPNFNFRSADDKKRWLFEVKKLMPVKSTQQKDKGMPSIPWERVLHLPPDIRKLYKPAVDKQTLKIIADEHGDPLVTRFLDVLAVGNVCQTFLKMPEMDDEGRITKENGIHYWLSPVDNRVHGNNSATETGRARSWKPNTLNWPSFVHTWIARAMAEVLNEQNALGILPDKFREFLDVSKIPSVRSIVDISEMPPIEGSWGWCATESDFITAEIRGMAFMSGDGNLIKILTEDDLQFGFVDVLGDIKKVRLCYTDDCGIPVENRRPEYIMTIAANKEILGTYSENQLLRDESGNILHPPHDVHWSLVEWAEENPREMFIEKLHRVGMGKCGNFSTAYGATGETLERKLKSETGKTPPPGTGQKILDALRKRQPLAFEWLEYLAEIPATKGYWQMESGAKRRAIVHADNVRGLSNRQRMKQLSTLGRQFRNFPMQNSVADTAARAGKNLMQYYRDFGFKAQLAICLYDSLVTIHPAEERFLVRAAHEEFMTTRNMWHNHGREWNYTSEHEFNLAWSEKPSKEIKKLLYDKNWSNNPTWVRQSSGLVLPK